MQNDNINCVPSQRMRYNVATAVERVRTQRKNVMSEIRMVNLERMGKAARTASRTLATFTTVQKNVALLAIADEVEAQIGSVIARMHWIWPMVARRG